MDSSGPSITVSLPEDLFNWDVPCIIELAQVKSKQTGEEALIEPVPTTEEILLEAGGTITTNYGGNTDCKGGAYLDSFRYLQGLKTERDWVPPGETDTWNTLVGNLTG